MTGQEVPLANDGSERPVRASTTFRKVIDGFRLYCGAGFYANVHSVLNTGRRRGLSAFRYIQGAIGRKSLIQLG